MAIIDLTSTRDFANQKVYSASSAIVNWDDLGTKDNDDNAQLFVLPAGSLLVAGYVIVNEVTDANVGIYFKYGSTPFWGSKSFTVKGALHSLNVRNQTGNAQASGTDLDVETGVFCGQYRTNTTQLTKGNFTVVMKYIEPHLNSGHLTKYSKV